MMRRLTHTVFLLCCLTSAVVMTSAATGKPEQKPAVSSESMFDQAILGEGTRLANFESTYLLLLLDETPLPPLVGTWIGTWEDTRYNVSGTLSFTIIQNGSNFEASGTIGLQQLRLSDETGTATGTISGNRLSFIFSSGTVGSGSGTITGNDAQGSGTVTGVLNFGEFTFSGTATNNQLSGTFEFTSPTGGWGVASLTKQ